MSIEERFWSKVDVRGPDDCWTWKAATRAGYGRFWDGSRLVNAQCFAWESEHGPMPEGKCGLHRCDNPPCCNPAHIFPGTKKENSLDMVVKGRHGSWTKPDSRPRGDDHHSRSRREVMPRGEDHWNTIIPDTLLATIQQRYDSDGVTQAQLCREFGISSSHMSRIVNRKTRLG